MSFLEGVRSQEAFAAIPRPWRTLVVYSEGRTYWPHLRGLIRELLDVQAVPVVYVTSDSADPGLHVVHPLLRTLNIGEGGARVNFFKELEADIVVMTMPDLDRLTIARSKSVGRYVYLFHSPVSTHMVYRDGAFDAYDDVFCVGPHHEQEIRAREAQLGLREKRLFAHGYPRLDELLASSGEAGEEAGGQRQILIAPSWGPHGLIETGVDDAVAAFLEAGYRVVVRPHPQTSRLASEQVEALRSRFGQHDSFVLEQDMASKDSFHRSDVMVCDWSGAAFDFAFTRLRPVLFVDTPRKVNNEAYASLGIEPIEATLRDEVGAVVAPGDPAALVEAAGRLIAEGGARERRIEAARAATVYNVGQSDARAAAELTRLTLGLPAGADEIEDRRALATDCALRLLAEREGDVADTQTLLRGALQADALDDATLAALENACREIDVFRRLRASYAGPFTTPGEGNAPVACLLALAVLLTTGAVGTPDRGLAFKLLNSAGNALDLYVNKGGTEGAVAAESYLWKTAQTLAEAS